MVGSTAIVHAPYTVRTASKEGLIRNKYCVHSTVNTDPSSRGGDESLLYALR
jgi:hypothetical protein